MGQPKLKWKVKEAPTGPYRSFARRGWPWGLHEGKVMITFVCDDDYRPARVATGEHKPLTVRVADRSNGPSPFIWRSLSAKADTLSEAKKMAQEFFNKNPEFFGLK
jgi:hypothetical protein